MAHDLIHIAVLHSSDSPTKAAFARMNIGVAQVKLGFGAVVSKVLNDCSGAQRRKFNISPAIPKTSPSFIGAQVIQRLWMSGRELRN
jgi:hypothetical protein